jgi:hypothetical protein
MKTYSFVLVLLTCISCVTPSRLGVNYKGQRIIGSSTKTVENPNIDLTVNSLTKQDVGYDVKVLKNRFISYIYKNEVLVGLIQKYPDLKIEIDITPSEHIKRTWFFDAVFFFPGYGQGWPYTPWWGTTNLSAKMNVTMPNNASNQFTFNSSEPFKIQLYPYYRAGRLLTENYSVTYDNLFEQVSTFSFNELAEISKSQTIPSNSIDNKYIFKHGSDVDKDIPDLDFKNQSRFALIIGNEDYASQQSDLTNESNVPFARNDASAFKEYAIKVLGIPDENITFILDATTGKMKQAIDKISRLSKNSLGNAELFFYYAGHGLPDEISKEPYLIPVDVSGSNLTDGIPLAAVYKESHSISGCLFQWRSA